MALGVRRHRPCCYGARIRPGGLSGVGGPTPVIERWEFSRRVPLPRIVAMKPIRPHAVKAAISGSIKAEGMPPSFRICGPENVTVHPLDEPEPKKFWLAGVRLAVGVQSGNKTRTSLIEDRLHLGGYTALHFDHQTKPVCECAPLNEFRNRSAKPRGIDEFKLRLGPVARPSPQGNLSFAVSRCHFH